MGKTIDITIYLSAALGLLASLYLALAEVVAFPAPPSGPTAALLRVAMIGLVPLGLVFLLRLWVVNYDKTREQMGIDKLSKPSRASTLLLLGLAVALFLLKLVHEINYQKAESPSDAGSGGLPRGMRIAANVLLALGAIMFFGPMVLEVLDYLPARDDGIFPAALGAGFGILMYSTIFARLYAANAQASARKAQ